MLEDRALLTVVTVTNPTDTAVAGEISLRQAIAELHSSADIVQFASNLNGSTITLTQGPLILSSGNIEGDNQITINGNNAGQVFAIFSGSAVLSGLTIEGGNAGASGNGGGVDNAFGTVALTNCTITGNTAAAGGGVYNSGTMTVNNCTVSDNVSSSTSNPAEGGGIFSAPNSTLTVTNSTISGNQATGSNSVGGGVYNTGSQVTVANCSISNNTAADGAGIANAGDLIVSDSAITGNTAASGGGGIDNIRSLGISGCTLNGNSATAGGGIDNSADLAVTSSTITGNSATGTGSGDGVGGGITNSGDLSVTNCTISANSAAVSGGGIESTPTFDPLVLINSIVAANTGTDPDVSGVLGIGNGDLVGDGTGMTGPQIGSNNQIGTAVLPINPQLAALAANGGPTETMAPESGSPALGAGGAANVFGGVVNGNQELISVEFPLTSSSAPADFVILVDSEQMLVTGVAGEELTVVRGYDGTAQANHNTGADIYLVTDQRGYSGSTTPDIGAVQSTGTAPPMIAPLTTTATQVAFTSDPLNYAGTPTLSDASAPGNGGLGTGDLLQLAVSTGEIVLPAPVSGVLLVAGQNDSAGFTLQGTPAALNTALSDIQFISTSAFGTLFISPLDPSSGIAGGGLAGPTSLVDIAVAYPVSSAPTSSVMALPLRTSITSFNVTWSGTPGSGGPITFYNIDVSTNGGAFTAWLTHTTLTSSLFTATMGDTYRFISQAQDASGNLEPMHTTADTTTTIAAHPWQNPNDALDVLGTGSSIVPADVLAVIDYLNAHPGNTTLPPSLPAGSDYYDVLGTGEVVPNDALQIINYLNLHPAVAAPAVIDPASRQSAVPDPAPALSTVSFAAQITPAIMAVGGRDTGESTPAEDELLPLNSAALAALIGTTPLSPGPVKIAVPPNARPDVDGFENGLTTAGRLAMAQLLADPSTDWL